MGRYVRVAMMDQWVCSVFDFSNLYGGVLVQGSIFMCGPKSSH